MKILVVGAGLYGAVFARLATDAGHYVRVIEQQEEIGGLCYSRDIGGVQVHEYGPHIFNTTKDHIWEFVNQFDEFVPFKNSPIAVNNGHIYTMPINLYTYYELFGVYTPHECRKIIQDEVNREKIGVPKNFEESVLKSLGRTVYETLIRDYTEKKWKVSCKDLPPSTSFDSIPKRFNFDNNYFNSKYSGIPKHGYTYWISKILEGIDIEYGNFFDYKEYAESHYDKIVFTGSLDEFFNYDLGVIPFLSTYLVHKLYNTDDESASQGNAVFNYTSSVEPYTRKIEHNLFMPSDDHKYIVISEEYNEKYYLGSPYLRSYPTYDGVTLYNKYRERIDKDPKYIIGGFAGDYKDRTMTATVEDAISKFNESIES